MKKIIGLLTIVISLSACKKGGSSGGGSGPTPGAATLIAPAKDQICTTGTSVTDSTSSVAFTWKGGDNTKSYDISIKNLTTQKITTKSSSGTQLSVTLLKNTPYSWYITSKNDTKNTTKSGVWKFYNAGNGIVTYAPYPAEIVAPLLGAHITANNGKINLSWKGGGVVSGKLIGYTIYFGPSSNPDAFRSNIKDTFVNDVAVSTNTTYYWHVITIDSNYNISDSGMYNFFVNP